MFIRPWHTVRRRTCISCILTPCGGVRSELYTASINVCVKCELTVLSALFATVFLFRIRVVLCVSQKVCVCGLRITCLFLLVTTDAIFNQYQLVCSSLPYIFGLFETYIKTGVLGPAYHCLILCLIIITNKMLGLHVDASEEDSISSIANSRKSLLQPNDSTMYW